MMRSILAIMLALAVGPAWAGAFDSVAPGGSGSMVTPTGATTARSAADSAADVYNVLNNGVVGNCATADNGAIQTLLNRASAAASAGGAQAVVVFPAPPGGCYAFAGTVAVPSNVDLEPVGRVVLQSQGSVGQFFTMTSKSNIRIGAFVLDSQKAINTSIAQPITITSSHDIIMDHVTLTNPTGSFVVTSSYNIHILSPDVQNSLYHGVYFNGVYDSEVLNGNFQNNVGFGVILAGTNYRNLLMGNHTTANGIELIGVTYASYQNRIIGNHAEGTGDNCISITGHENTIIGNEMIGCAGNGLHIYGDRNTAIGNYAKNNATGRAGNSTWRAGIAIAQGFGGMAQNNVISGNVTVDDQVSPSQQYGIWIAASVYSAWSGTHAYTSGNYVYQGLNLYQASNSATSGASAPTCTSGTCSDGAVTWTFVSKFTGNTNADHNEVAGNNYNGNALNTYLDASGATGNEFIGGFAPLVLPTSLTASSIGNPGSVSAITPTVGSLGTYNNGSVPTVTIGAPATGGSQATATATMKILGFGSIASGGTGYTVNDILTLVGGAVTAGPGEQIKVTAVSGGVVTAFTGQTFDIYTSLPSAGNTSWTGGTGSGFSTTGMVWQLNSVTVTAGGSNYLTAPAVTFSAGVATAQATASLSSTMTISAGAGSVGFGASGTTVGGTQGLIVGAPSGSAPATGTINAQAEPQINGVAIILSGTTTAIGGSSLAAGVCTTGTVAVTSSTTAMPVAVSPTTYPGDGIAWSGYVSVAGTVTVRLCNTTSGAITPTSSTYNVRVVQ